MRLGNRGNVAIITALCLPVIVGGGAFGIEVGYWRYDQVRLQQAADAAAYAAAVVRRADGASVSNATLTAAATAAAASNGFTVGSDSITINTPSTATPADPNAVEAVISRVEPPIFTTYIRCMLASWQNSSCSDSMATVRASSTATYTDAGDACVLALSPGASKAADFAGSSSLTLSGCTVMSNSLASNAFNIQGASILGAPCVYATGGAYVGGTLNLTQCTSVKTGQPPVADPYMSLTVPTPSNDQTLNGNQALQCNTSYSGGVTIRNTQSLSCPANQPIIIDGGALSINANANFTCTGCTIVLDNGASMSVNGNAHLDLSAPTSGTYSGMLIVSDRSNTSSITMNGDSTSSITGAIYAPDGNVSYVGNFSGVSGCTQIVAQTVSWSGSTSFADDCAAAGMGKVKIGSVVKTVGMIRRALDAARRLGRAAGGAAAVEFAIVTPFLAAMLVGVVQYGGMIVANQQMHDGVSAAAVYVMRGGSDSSTIQSIATGAWPNKPSDAAVTVSQFCSCAGVTQACSVLCADGSYPQGYTTISATGTYSGVWENSSMSTSQVVRTQ